MNRCEDRKNCGPDEGRRLTIAPYRERPRGETGNWMGSPLIEEAYFKVGQQQSRFQNVFDMRMFNINMPSRDFTPGKLPSAHRAGSFIHAYDMCSIKAWHGSSSVVEMRNTFPDWNSLHYINMIA